MTQEVFDIIRFSVPMQVALICGLLLWRMARFNDFVLGRKMLMIAVGAFGMAFFNWQGVILYLSAPCVFVVLNSLILLTFTSVNIVYYRFIFELTKTDPGEKFPAAHYILPLLGFTVMFVWSFFVPFETQLSLVESRGAWAEDYRAYSAFFTFKPSLYMLFDIAYTLFGLRRAMRFRRAVVNYSADEQRSSLVWLYQFLFVMLFGLPMMLVTLLLDKNQLFHSWFIPAFMLVIILKDIIFTHNILLENFVVIKPETATGAQPPEAPQIPQAIRREDIKRLEAYMRREKPYLEPRLKITDMTGLLNTNRTSLSQLINRTYGMHFSRFINRYRLDELEKIRTDPGNAGLSELELVIKAGFSDWRGYQRVKQREESGIDEPINT